MHLAPVGVALSFWSIPMAALSRMSSENAGSVAVLALAALSAGGAALQVLTVCRALISLTVLV